MPEPLSSTHPERRADGDRRRSSPRSIYDRLDETIRKIGDDRRTARRRRDDPPAPARRRMSIDEALQLAAEVAKEENPRLVVVGLTGSDGSTNYVELLIAIKGCHVDPCRLTIGFDRTIAPARLRGLLLRRIREHLRDRTH
jgi:hypothetical protein